MQNVIINNMYQNKEILTIVLAALILISHLLLEEVNHITHLS